MDLTGKRAIVTGAARGIGFATARTMAGAGAAVALLDLNAQRLEESVASLDGKATGVVCDVRDEARVAEAVDEAVAWLGGVDVLVNNAGVSFSYSPTHEYPLDRYAAVLDVNLTGVIRVSQAVAPRLLAQGSGAVVNVASIAGVQGAGGNSPYAASKWGVIGVTRTMAQEWGRAGVRANSVSPGMIRTEMWGPLPEDRAAMMVQRVPLGRWGSADEVAAVIAFLASDAASYVNGANVVIDGGVTA